MLKIIPLNDRVLVKRLASTEEMKNGLYIPETAMEKPQEGVVIAAGEGRIDRVTNIRTALNVTAGDLVLFGKYSGNEVEVGGDKYLVLREDEILAKIKDDEPEASLETARSVLGLPSDTTPTTTCIANAQSTFKPGVDDLIDQDSGYKESPSYKE